MKKLFAIVVLAMLVITCMVGVAAAFDTGFKAGSVTGTGANITVSLGWTPNYLVVSNTSVTTPVTAEWTTGMSAASCLKTMQSVTAENIFTKATTSCLSVYSGSTTTAKGFTIGTDADLNATGDTLYWKAWR